MGLIYERSPLGEIKEEKEKGKKGEWGRPGPWAHEGCAPSPLAGHLPLAKGFSPTLLGESG